jgi:hypothetical protein
VDAYLQLKSCHSEKLRGKILIDSPGFDADAQRTSTLRITNHIVDLSDLVLVLFDARHPESGSMPETLAHLVRDTIHRHDSNKFLYILNQIDATAQEDNPEQVFAAWQRALAHHGLTAGRFYSIYSPDVALPIENAELRKRFESKRDADLAEIYNRIEQVRVERAYRIVGMLEQTARLLERDVVTRIREFVESWRRWVLRIEGGIVLLLLVLLVALSAWLGYWEGLRLHLPPLERLMASGFEVKLGVLAALLVAAGYVHFSLRRWAADRVMARMLAKIKDPDTQANFARAFRKNSRWWRTMFRRNPVGWGRRALKSLAGITEEVNAYIQKLNDEYTNPSGDRLPPPGEAREKMAEQGSRPTILGVVEDAPEDPKEEPTGTGDARG